MATTKRTGSAALSLLAFWFAACSAAPSSATPSSATPTSPSPSAIASPRTSAPSQSLTPTATPTASPTPSAAIASWYPWLPPIDSSVEALFEVDSFVSGSVDVVPVSDAPGGPPFRFDTGDPDPSNDPLMGFPKNGLLVVLHGPVVVDDVQWYLLTPAQLAIDYPTGWSPASAADGTRYLQRDAIECPASPIQAASLQKSVLTDGLPACYGESDVTIVGELRCHAGVDDFATGATWLTNGRCGFGPPPSVYGLDPGQAAGTYAVTGHFLDPQARDCGSRDGDDSPMGRLQAVLHCRRAFVATSAVPAR
jgi:hypothetical protein